MRSPPTLSALAAAALLFLLIPATGCGDEPKDSAPDPQDSGADDTGEPAGPASRDLLGDGTPWTFHLLGSDSDCTGIVGPLGITATISGSDTAAFVFDAEITAQSIDGTGTFAYPVSLSCSLADLAFSCDEATFEESSKHNAHVSIVLSGDFDESGRSATVESLSQFWVRDEVDCSTTSDLEGEAVE